MIYEGKCILLDFAMINSVRGAIRQESWSAVAAGIKYNCWKHIFRISLACRLVTRTTALKSLVLVYIQLVYLAKRYTLVVAAELNP